MWLESVQEEIPQMFRNWNDFFYPSLPRSFDPANSHDNNDKTFSHNMNDEQEMRDEEKRWGWGMVGRWVGVCAGVRLRLQVESNTDVVLRSEKSYGPNFIFNLLYIHEENHISQSQCCALTFASVFIYNLAMKNIFYSQSYVHVPNSANWDLFIEHQPSDLNTSLLIKPKKPHAH